LAEQETLASLAAQQPSPTGEKAETGPLGSLVIAHFQRVEIAMLGQVLITTLGGALPPSIVRVERRRSLWARLTGQPGQSIGVTITASDRTLSFRTPALGIAEASIGHAVRGVVLSTSPVSVSQWLDELGGLLNELTREDQTTRIALERALLS
jgi:hypothetical protein